MNDSFKILQHHIRVIADEVRSMAATVDEVKAVLERIGSRPVVSVCLEIQSQYLKDLENVARPTCGFCCHFQALPPRCQLSKRYISLINSHVRNTPLNTTHENESNSHAL